MIYTITRLEGEEMSMINNKLKKGMSQKSGIQIQTMKEPHVFNKESDSELLAMDI